MCFDKTGTLTEEGLDMYGVRGVFINSLKVFFLFEFKFKIKKKQIVKFDDLDPNPQKLINGSNSNNNYFNFGDPKLLLLEIMASCHVLIINILYLIKITDRGLLWYKEI